MMKWTAKKPTRLGYYWIWHTEDPDGVFQYGRIGIVEVEDRHIEIDDPNKPTVYCITRDGDWIERDIDYWMGPVKLPKPPVATNGTGPVKVGA